MSRQATKSSVKKSRPVKARPVPNTRRSFSVKGQLVGKLGPRGYGRLLDQLAKVAMDR